MTTIVQCPKCSHATHTAAIVNGEHLLLTCQLCATQIMFPVNLVGEFDRLVDFIVVREKKGEEFGMSLTWTPRDADSESPAPGPVSEPGEPGPGSVYRVVSWLLFWLVAGTGAWIGIIGLVKWAVVALFP